MGNSIKAGEAFLTLSVRDKDFRSQLNRSLGRLAGIGRSLRNIGSLGFGGIGGFQRVLFAIAGSAALSWPIKLAADLEQSTAAFTALTGSAEKARAILNELQLFAPIAAQSFDQLQHAARALLNYGVAADKVVPVVKTLAAIAGGNADVMDRLAIAFGQVQAKGKLAAEEVRQMVNAGFSPLQEITKLTGKSFREVVADMEAGAISVEQVIQAFESATGPGGRFGGLLEAIAGTALGQFRIFKTAIQIAIRPLGEELLPSITGVLRRINELVPAFAAFVKLNAGFARVVGLGVAGTAALLGTLFALGITIQVATFSMGGLVAVIGTLLSPLALIVIAITAAAAAFVQFTTIGQSAVRFLSVRLFALLTVARDTFAGIADALANGNIQAAVNILWTGLKVAWLEGTQELHETANTFRRNFSQVFIDAFYGVQIAFVKFKDALLVIWRQLQTEFLNVAVDIGAFFSKLGLSEEAQAGVDKIVGTLKNKRETDLNEDLAAIKEKKKAEIAAIREEQDVAAGIVNKQFNDALSKRRKELREAKKALKDLKEAEQAKLPDGLLAAGGFQAALAGVGGAAAGIRSRTAFGGKGLEQIFGGIAKADPVPRQQLIENRKQTKLLEQLNRKKAFDLRVGGA